jgi:hypothetical protein
VNFVSDGIFVTRGNGALKPSDGLVDPIVVMRRIGSGFLTTDCGLGYTLLALIHTLPFSLRLQPSLRYRTFDDVPLNSLALRTGKRSQIMARIARLDCHQLHGRAACHALRTLILCIEHRRPSVRCYQFSGKPSCGNRIHGIAHHDHLFDQNALGTIEQLMLKSDGAETDAR